MAWLRIDDSFAQHPKFEGWTAAQKWALVELLLYCARHKTDGYVPADLSLLPRSVTPALLQKAVDSAFIDRDADALVVHDWRVYNPADPTAAERMRRHRERNRSRNETRNTVSNESVSSRVRLPSRPPEVSDDTSGERPRDELWDALAAELGEPATKNERGRRNAAVKQLREIATTGDEVRRRCRAYRRLWPDITLTDMALVSNWSTLDQRPPAADVRQSVEEVVDLPELSDDQRQAYLERSRALAESIGKPA